MGRRSYRSRLAAIWENEITLPSGENKAILKASLERRYRDRTGEWKPSCSFGRNEIPLARHVLQKAGDAGQVLRECP